MSITTNHGYSGRIFKRRNHEIMNATLEQPEATAQAADKLISTAEVSRLLNVPVARVKKGIMVGAITPEQICLDGRLHLHRLSSLSSIRARLETLDAVQPTS